MFDFEENSRVAYVTQVIQSTIEAARSHRMGERSAPQFVDRFQESTQDIDFFGLEPGAREQPP